MATVASLIDLFDGLALGRRGSFERDSKVALLNVAQIELWKILVGTDPQDNWFVQESQDTDSSAVDFFGPITTTSRDYPLPNNLHQMRAIEVTNTGLEGIRFTKARLDSGEFRQQRGSQLQFDTEALYDLYGVSPGRIIFSAFPKQTLNVKLWYARKPTAWTEATDVVDDYPFDTHSIIADYAVKRGLMGITDKAFYLFERAWAERVIRWLTTYRRDNTDVSVVDGFLEGSGTVG